MISDLELRQIIESGFLPLKCVCSIDPEGRMTVCLYQSQKGHAAFIAEGITTEHLTSSRAISALVGELKQEFARKGFGAEPEQWLLRG
jgi:hypothetical protein